MISFKEYFLEAYIHNNPFEFNFSREEGKYRYNFKVEDTEYSCDFVMADIDFPVIDNVYEFSFGNEEDGKLNFKLLKSYGISTVRKIFSTIEEIFVDFFFRKADAIYFTATPKEPTRVRFYQFLLKTLQKEYKYRYVNRGMVSILLNPDIDDGKVNEFKKHVRDDNILEYMMFGGRDPNSWHYIETENGESRYTYNWDNHHFEISISESNEEYPSIDNSAYSKSYVLKILNASGEEDPWSALHRFVFEIVKDTYKGHLIIIDAKKNDPYFDYYEYITNVVGVGSLRGKNVERDRIIWYMTY